MIGAPVTAVRAQAAVDSAAVYFRNATELNKLNAARQSQAALAPLRRSLELYRERRDSVWEAKVLIEMGRAYQIGFFRQDSSKMMMLQARDVLHARGDRAGEAEVLLELGMEEARGEIKWPSKAVYLEARGYLMEADRLWLSLGDSTHRPRVLAQAGLYWLEDNADSALVYTARAQRIARTARDTSGELLALHRTSAVYMRISQRSGDLLSRRLAMRDSAVEYSRFAMSLGRESGNFF